jgi:hypothetical protein
MKVDRNQLVDGIPLRLDIAQKLVAACFSDVPMHLAVKCVTECLEFADALIDAHNATCGEVAGE